MVTNNPKDDENERQTDKNLGLIIGLSILGGLIVCAFAYMQYRKYVRRRAVQGLSDVQARYKPRDRNQRRTSALSTRQSERAGTFLRNAGKSQESMQSMSESDVLLPSRTTSTQVSGPT